MLPLNFWKSLEQHQTNIVLQSHQKCAFYLEDKELIFTNIFKNVLGKSIHELGILLSSSLIQ